MHAASAPFHLMTKPAGSACNLDCAYCFYLEKEKLYDRGTRFRMTDETLDRFVRSYIESQPADAPVIFAWQGGEPTLMGIDFYRRAVALQNNTVPVASSKTPSKPTAPSSTTTGEPSSRKTISLSA